MITLSRAQARTPGGGKETVHLLQFAVGCRSIPQGDYTAREFSAALKEMDLSPSSQLVVFDLGNLEEMDDAGLAALQQLNQEHPVRFVVKSVTLRRKLQSSVAKPGKPINLRTDISHALC